MDETLKEIAYSPVPLVALFGLDVGKPLHSQVWNTFAINRVAERPSIYYKLITSDHTFTPAKSKKSYERYIPSGIIKKSWLAKHLFEVPSVAVIFEEVCLEVIQSDEWRRACFEHINSTRQSLLGRGTKIVVVFLTTQPTITDDLLYKDTVAKLCASCDINLKSLFVVQTHDQTLMSTYILRIEHSLNELAKSYYANKAKMVKSHKDQLNKSLQCYLFVRLEFKLGFFHETRQIYSNALGHYKNAYASLMEIRKTPANVSEIKTVACLLNYKICRLCFFLNNPLDAISYFKKHIDIFQDKYISNQIEFEQFAWLSKQFYLFAELFDMAVNLLKLAPSPTQHPGVYYFESALYLIERRRAASCFSHLKNEPTEEISRMKSILEQPTEYVGQLPWPRDPDNEPEKDLLGMKALQYEEQLVDHTALLIKLYSNVLSQIKKFKKPRFMQYLKFLIGEEYYKLGNYNEALTYFTNILPFYRDEKWQVLYFKVAHLAMSAAYQACDLDNFIKCGFEMLSNETITNQERIDLLECILSLLDSKFKPLQMLTSELLEERWCAMLQSVIQKECPHEVLIAMDRELGCFECKVAFTANRYDIDDKINISLLIFNHLPLDIDNLSIGLKFNNSHYDNLYHLIDSSQVTLKANSMNRFTFQMMPQLEDLGKEIKINEIVIKMGTKLVLTFKWVVTNSTKSSLMIIPDKTDTSIFKHFEEQISAVVLEHTSKLLVEVQSQDIFVNENAPIQMKFTSTEKYPISKLKLCFKILTPDEQIDPSYSLFAIENGQLCQVSDMWIIAEQLKPGETITQDLILRTPTAGNKTLDFAFAYDLLFERDKKMQFLYVNHRVISKINAIEPFMVSSTVSNFGTSDTANIRIDEPFCLRLNLTPLNEIIIQDIVPYFAEHLRTLSRAAINQFPCSLPASSTLQEVFTLSSCIESSSPLSLGCYRVKWVRKENCAMDSSLVMSESIYQLPIVSINSSIVFVELQLPKQSFARQPFLAKYIIHNRLDVDMLAEIILGSSDFFMTSGNRLAKILIQSKGYQEQNFIFFPLSCGLQELPRLEITVHLAGKNPISVDYINQMISSTIYVLPKAVYSIE